MVGVRRVSVWICPILFFYFIFFFRLLWELWRVLPDVILWLTGGVNGPCDWGSLRMLLRVRLMELWGRLTMGARKSILEL